MAVPRATILAWAYWLTFASSVTIILGIAPSQILLGCALLALLASHEKPALPPIKLPLGLFLFGTLLAMALSADPLAGLPQLKKFFVFCQLIVVYTLLRDSRIARRVVCTWAVFAAASSLLGLYQLAVKLSRLHQQGGDLYAGYVSQRITGFMSHWYTFSVEQMLVLLMLGSFLFFSSEARRYLWLWIGLAAITALGIVLAETRAVWIATVIGVAYLVFRWRPWAALAIPVVVALGLLVAPPIVRERAVSIVRPGPSDSNEFRAILLRTGVRMVKAHPWFGLGPEMPRRLFMDYLPEDTPRPLPPGSYMHLHNIYLHYAAERGIPVLLVLLWLFGKILWDFLRGLRDLPSECDSGRFILHGGVAAVIALMIEGVADVNLGDSEVLTMFLVIVSLGYNVLNRTESKLTPQPWPPGTQLTEAREP